MKILITGAAGFIGFHLAKRLLSDGYQVHGIDNLNDYYDIALKCARLERLKHHKQFSFQLLDLVDREGILQLFQDHKFDYVVNLAAQAGVRYSLKNPHTYIDSNITGFVNLLEGCRNSDIQHLIFASSSSVYGANTKIPFSVQDNVDYPVSLYAATKKSNELIAHSYSHLYGIPTTGLRFFTVYGAWGRPDMAYFKFVKAIAEGTPIEIYNYGKMQRDFTFIDDIIEGVVRVMTKIPTTNTDATLNSNAAYKLYNIGNNNPVELMQFVETIEQLLGSFAIKKFLPMQPGDVPMTYADVDDLMQEVGFKPETSLEEGLFQFVQWYREYYETPSRNKYHQRPATALI
ncbi:NAD-dependent epimerase [Phormidesmis sp. 146-35]